MTAAARVARNVLASLHRRYRPDGWRICSGSSTSWCASRGAGESSIGEAAPRVLGEGDDVADGGFAGHQDHGAVEADGGAAVWGSAVAERVEHEAEALCGFRLRAAEDCEYAALQRRIVDPDRAAGQFDAVVTASYSSPRTAAGSCSRLPRYCACGFENMWCSASQRCSSSYQANSGKSVTKQGRKVPAVASPSRRASSVRTAPSAVQAVRQGRVRVAPSPCRRAPKVAPGTLRVPQPRDAGAAVGRREQHVRIEKQSVCHSGDGGDGLEAPSGVGTVVGQRGPRSRARPRRSSAGTPPSAGRSRSRPAGLWRDGPTRYLRAPR